ncbi:DNA-binding transcription factor [Aspergillus nanangensis]|uniref:DNA-binding transcription factor n=1 Tax=Aspergillus nanangensis TaxID=2582783 RepID=A0AAD4CU23_ASPNN|nr:DNA-binding transcription factor [Aspergillus nanangensis]
MASQETEAPAAGAKNRSMSPHPQSQQPYNDPSLTLDPSVTVSSSFLSSNSFPTNDPTSESYAYNAAYLSGAHTLAPPDQLQLPQHFDPSLVDQSAAMSAQHQHQPPPEGNFSNLLNSNPTDFDFSGVYQNHSPNSVTSPEYDSSLMLDPQMSNQAINPADLVNQMPSPLSAASPQEQQQPHHSSPGPMSPPSSTPGTYYTPQHSRHTSLDPATAAYMTGNDWQAVMSNVAFQGHRRAPSEVSEVSSAAHSPYLSQHESFDGVDNNPSPLLAPQNDPSLFDNALGIESFTLSDQHQQHAPGLSPGHSPYISPQLMPQQGGEMVPSMPYVSAPPGNQYPTPPTNDIYGNGTEGVVNMAPGNAMIGDIGQASQMAPPSINVEFAPPSRDLNYPFSLSKPSADFDSLSPPPMRSRGRSKSDPYANPASRSRTPVSTSSSLEPLAPSSPRSLSPFDSMGRQPHSNPSSREASPARSNRRLSTSSIDSRNYILGLADPQRPGASLNDSKRVQKHPATFQCHLCPKRFTRAYNLRSHLRTHTDERPFVCTVCGKAFARQHDRKRHEGLHSGEKKFVCRGELSRGGQWGCGRRFARADALGRHFRSEAGRICIKPLLDEESQERERTMLDHQQQHLQPIPQPLMVPGMDGQHANNFVLPAALLAQYPALQTLQWDQIPATSDDPSDMGGRSSFDASSGGEFGLDDDDSGISSVSGLSGGYPSPQDNLYGMNSQAQMLGNPEWRE